MPQSIAYFLRFHIFLQKQFLLLIRTCTRQDKNKQKNKHQGKQFSDRQGNLQIIQLKVRLMFKAQRLKDKRVYVFTYTHVCMSIQSNINSCKHLNIILTHQPHYRNAFIHFIVKCKAHYETFNFLNGKYILDCNKNWV